MPVGWTSLGEGPLNVSYQLQFAVSIGGRERNVQLYQMLDSSLGAVANIAAGGRGMPQMLEGRPAWVFDQEGAVSVAWSVDGRASLLVVPGVSAEEALSLAGELTAGHSGEWKALLGQDQPAPGATTSTVAFPSPTSCARHTLEWLPAP